MSITIRSSTTNHEPTSTEKTCLCMYDGKPEQDCYFCKGSGIETVSDVPEVNMSNTNALTILEMILESKPDYGGQIENKDIPKYLRRIIFLKNTPKKTIAQNVRPTEKDKNFFSMGIDEDYIAERLTQVENILRYAQEHGEDVSWD